MKKWQALLLIAFILLVGIVFIFESSTSPTVSFFPLDPESTVEYASTSLTLLSEEGTNKYEVDWKVASASDKIMYLRQDVSLLFDNGRLRGVRSKWQQNTKNIQVEEKVRGEDSRHFQSISFHHGENHYSDEAIRSIQKMSFDELYVIDSPTTPIASFKTPANAYESKWKELLDRTSRQQLLFHWHELVNYFHIDLENYISLPLVDMYKYENQALPQMSQEETNNLIGRLWEGLYKNYIIPAMDPPNNKLNSFIPLILIDKEGEHLLVIFEFNGKKEQLIQRIPSSASNSAKY
ncbi:hypothetical protein [Oceanobacillus damuensis]|uniref:hypothetical protein n=1 Tax=Oceanobacillus damuensis TaxID=937928 RepID=UPI0008379587|nr:hypothetical protein [Oceanobacillus damuensis]